MHTHTHTHACMHTHTHTHNYTHTHMHSPVHGHTITHLIANMHMSAYTLNEAVALWNNYVCVFVSVYVHLKFMFWVDQDCQLWFEEQKMGPPLSARTTRKRMCQGYWKHFLENRNSGMPTSLDSDIQWYTFFYRLSLWAMFLSVDFFCQRCLYFSMMWCYFQNNFPCCMFLFQPEKECC